MENEYQPPISELVQQVMRAKLLLEGHVKPTQEWIDEQQKLSQTIQAKLDKAKASIEQKERAKLEAQVAINAQRDLELQKPIETDSIKPERIETDSIKPERVEINSIKEEHKRGFFDFFRRKPKQSFENERNIHQIEGARR